MSLKHALLGFLTVCPATGYELKGIFENSVQHFWNADLSQIYRTLDEIKSEGLATVRVEPQEGKPPRHIYSLSEKGREEFLRWLREPVKDLPVIRNHFLLKIFFGAFLQKEEVIEHLKRYQSVLQERLAKYHEIEHMVPEQFEASLRSKGIIEKGKAAPFEPEILKNHLLYAIATLRLGFKIAEATNEWCTETINELQSASSGKPKSIKKQPIKSAKTRTGQRSHL